MFETVTGTDRPLRQAGRPAGWESLRDSERSEGESLREGGRTRNETREAGKEGGRKTDTPQLE